MTDRMLMLIFALAAVVLFVVCIAAVLTLKGKIDKTKKSALVDPVTEGLNFEGIQSEINKLILLLWNKNQS